MSAQHTPGPWKAFNSIKAIGVGSERSDVAWVRFEEYGLIDTARSQEEDKANARLIAAAPDLLEAIAGLVGCIDHGSESPTEKLDAARAAIAKASSASAT